MEPRVLGPAPTHPTPWQVLVLGLDGAGKSSVLHYICNQTARNRFSPTYGFSELHPLLPMEPQLPLVVLANKQDKSDALSTAELWEELALHKLSEQRELFLLPTSATWDSLSTANSILHVKNLLVTLLSQPLSALLQGEGSQPPPVQG
ncbi:PREDICTED: ADP-ribosylation factor-like protein 10 [Nestor notabilis]|uniref:ADP-ribosylation factor-like protein 10 n=1 Tax=Nestor notabilis TaxID=176057 RepID=UPI000523D091|nr:PREDICTED: ADP-ribosylation factor-like protein 10 [Nestor notabilis]